MGTQTPRGETGAGASLLGRQLGAGHSSGDATVAEDRATGGGRGVDRTDRAAMSFAGAVGSGGGSGGADAGGVAQPPDGNRASDPSTPPPTATSAANVSQSVPVHADWDKFSLSLFAAHPQHSDSEEDDLSRMVDHLVAEDASPTLSVEDAYSESFNEYARFAQGKLISSDAKSFSNTPYLFQSTSAAYHQHFPKPSPANNQTIQHSNSNSNTPANTINKFDSDDLTFDINDIDLDPMSFNGMNVTGIHPNQFGQPQSHLNGRSSILHPHSSHFPPLSSSAQNGKSGKSGPNSGANSSEQTPTSTFKALRQSINNTNGLIPELQLPNGGPGTLPPAPQSHHSRYSSNNNTSTQQKYGASPSYQLNQFSFSSSFNSSLAQPGTSPVLINSYVGSGNAMRPNGLIGTSAGSNGIALLSSSFDAASSTVNGFQGGTSPVGTSNLLGVANGPNASVAASYHGPQVLKSMGSNGRLDASARGLGIIGVDAKSSGSGTASPGMLLPPGRVVGGMVLGNPGVARSELAEDGCPVLKVPRMPFLGVPGTMEIPHRVWKKGGTEKPDNRHFMIMTYNVLAPMYCTDSRYHKTGEKDLDWDHRKTLILDEIAFYSPDFICLQELPPSDFKDVFLPALQKIGYDGHFQQKKREHAADGCAIFFLEARFSLMAVQAFAYNDQVPQDPASDLYQRLSPFPNIALVCVFQNRQARSLRCRIVNTHLHWDPACADTKLLQAAILMEWLERAPHRDVPTAIAADLNSRTGEAVVDYLVRGKVAPGPLFQGKDFGRFTKALTVRNPVTGVTVLASTLAGQPGFEGLLNGGVVIQNPNLPLGGGVPQHQTLLPLLRHGTKLASAYDRKDLPFTNLTPDFTGSIDHILYTSGTLSIRDVLGDFDQAYYPVAKKDDGEVDAGGGSGDENRSGDEREGGVDSTKRDSPDPGAVDANGEDERDVPSTPQGPPGPRPFHHHQPPAPVGYLAKITSFPTPHIPSDHLPLCAWLKWKTVPVGTGPINNGANGVLGSSVGTSNRARGGRRQHQQQQQQAQLQQQQQQQTTNMLSTSAPNRGLVGVAAASNGMSQVQMQLLLQHQHQQQQAVAQQQQQQQFMFQQKPAQSQGGVSALSMGLMNAGNPHNSLPRGYGPGHLTQRK